MIALLRVYRSQFRTTLASHLQYRVALLIWLIEMVLEPVIYMVVWSAVADANGGTTGGMSASDFAAYYIIFMVANHLTFTWVMWEFDYLIRTGYFSNYLLRPIHPIHRDIAENLTYKFLTAFIILPTAICLGLIFKPSIHLDVVDLTCFFLALILSFFIRFLFEWSLALAAFWTNRVSALNQVYYVLFMFMAGEIAPIPLLPETLRNIASWLPFRWMISFPVEIGTGQCVMEDLIRGFSFQILWIGIGVLTMLTIWRFSIRHYSAVGA